MEPNQLAAFQVLKQAQQHLKQGDKRLARQFAEQAAQLAPEREEVWLMMAALASPKASVEYLQKALQINPSSERAQKGLAWASQRLRQEQEEKPAPPPASVPQEQEETPQPAQSTTAAPVTAAPPLPGKSSTDDTAPIPVFRPKPAPKPATAQPQKRLTRSRSSYLVLLLILLCAAAVFAVYKGVTPAAAIPASGPAWSQAEISRATFTPTAAESFAAALTTPADTEVSAAALTATETAAPTQTFTETPASTETPTLAPTAAETLEPTGTPLPTDTPWPTDTEGPSPTPLPTDTAMPTAPIPTQGAAPTPAYHAAPGNGGERWIDVNLSQQMVYAYEGNTVVNSFVVSTGTWQYPTVTGQYRIYIKYLYKNMSGPGYYLPNVPYTMFFYQGYALHGTYWHHNFGTPMSHGCVNLSTPDSAWLYNFASVGTLVNIHY